MNGKTVLLNLVFVRRMNTAQRWYKVPVLVNFAKNRSREINTHVNVIQK